MCPSRAGPRRTHVHNIIPEQKTPSPPPPMVAVIVSLLVLPAIFNHSGIFPPIPSMKPALKRKSGASVGYPLFGKVFHRRGKVRKGVFFAFHAFAFVFQGVEEQTPCRFFVESKYGFS